MSAALVDSSTMTYLKASRELLSRATAEDVHGALHGSLQPTKRPIDFSSNQGDVGHTRPCILSLQQHLQLRHWLGYVGVFLLA